MNIITDIGAKFLFENMNKNCCLKEIEIDLSYNTIKYEGAEHISKAVIELANRTKKKKNLEGDHVEQLQIFSPTKINIDN